MNISAIECKSEFMHFSVFVCLFVKEKRKICNTRNEHKKFALCNPDLFGTVGTCWQHPMTILMKLCKHVTALRCTCYICI